MSTLLYFLNEIEPLDKENQKQVLEKRKSIAELLKEEIDEEKRIYYSKCLNIIYDNKNNKNYSEAEIKTLILMANSQIFHSLEYNMLYQYINSKQIQNVKGR